MNHFWDHFNITVAGIIMFAVVDFAYHILLILWLVASASV
jgi:hypothetical protein